MPAPIRAATWNVHDCIGRDGVYDPGRIADIVASLDADIVALQEVTLDRAGDVLDRLERGTGMQSIDGTLFDRGVGRYGNLLLSRLPVTGQDLHDISWPGREPRGVVDARIEAHGHTCRVLITHLGLQRRERRDQIARLAALIGDSAGPAVVLGDFNAWEGDRAFGPLHRLGMRATIVRTFPTWFAPLAAFDRILIRKPVGFVRYWIHRRPPAPMASDHFPLVAELELERSAAVPDR